MPRLAGMVATLVVLLLVAGCELALPGGGVRASPDVTPNAIVGDAIEVTALEEARGVAPAVAPGSPASDPALQPSPAAAAAGPEVASPAPAPAEDTVVAPPKSAAQLACEKKGDRWVRVGKSILQACVKVTRDSGKQCKRSTECESDCLARSGTCAPLKPLLGCNEILQDNGARVTQCIE